MNEIALRPAYVAMVSGGKDSLYMLKYILSHRAIYPLDAVVHFELDIDFPFIHDVIDYMRKECEMFGIKFYTFKPSHTWEELYYRPLRSKSGYDTILGFPTRRARWCNEKYKLEAQTKMEKFLNEFGYYSVRYIGFCADEKKRFKPQGARVREVYPLAEAGINEETILQWARGVSIFNNYYKTQRRCGCMYCPMSSRLNFAYLLKYYPRQYNYMIDKMKETEKLRELELGKPFSVISSNPRYNAEYLDDNVRNKWLHVLNEMESGTNDGEYLYKHFSGRLPR